MDFVVVTIKDEKALHIASLKLPFLFFLPRDG
jgi:hypothetical protein